MNNNRYTPSTIGNKKFSIPLYQRLFEWEEKQIKQLLNDLYSSFVKDKEQPYYIGMFTVYNEHGMYTLVDGQQRFTVLTLMAIAFEADPWYHFLKNENCNRLSFFARRNDELYLKYKIEKSKKPDYINLKMEKGIKIIQEFIEKLDIQQKRTDFINYIYNHATFFISELPVEYNANDLNRYFEAMNATGRGLENHEILKVSLLKKLNSSKEFYSKIWNAVSEMDKCLVRQKLSKNNYETVETFEKRVKESLVNLNDTHLLFKICNDSENTYEEDASKYNSLRKIEHSTKTPGKQIQTRSERAILNFSEFLLQVLWIQLSEEERKESNDFFNTLKLQDTFQKHLQDRDVELYMKNLLRYRILFDYFILRINNSDQNETSYFLNFSEDNSEIEDMKQLLQYQAMLYVSTTSHLWLTDTLVNLQDNNKITAPEYLYNLKDWDNHRQIKRTSAYMDYHGIDRYWFWRLDYYLWERRKELFKEKSLEIANNYIFKRNRSIEHIATQNPKSTSNVQVKETFTHCFGNLVMISSGQNSSLQNESFEIKRAHVISFIKGERNGSIESLKMLDIYDYDTWNEDIIKFHSDKMIKILIQSFPDECENISFLLKSQLYEVKELVLEQ